MEIKDKRHNYMNFKDYLNEKATEGSLDIIEILKTLGYDGVKKDPDDPDTVIKIIEDGKTIGIVTHKLQAVIFGDDPEDKEAEIEKALK